MKTSDYFNLVNNSTYFSNLNQGYVIDPMRKVKKKSKSYLRKTQK